MFDLKKYRGVIFHETEESCKIWRKTGLRFGKWHEEFECMSLKLTGELCVMTMKNDAKFEMELTFQFKIDIDIDIKNFDPSTRESQKLAL